MFDSEKGIDEWAINRVLEIIEERVSAYDFDQVLAWCEEQIDYSYKSVFHIAYDLAEEHDVDLEYIYSTYYKMRESSMNKEMV